MCVYVCVCVFVYVYVCMHMCVGAQSSEGARSLKVEGLEVVTDMGAGN